MGKFRHKRYGQRGGSKAEGSIAGRKSYCVVKSFETRHKAVLHASESGGVVKAVKHPYTGNPKWVKRRGTYRDNPKLFVRKHKYDPDQHDSF